MNILYNIETNYNYENKYNNTLKREKIDTSILFIITLTIIILISIVIAKILTYYRIKKMTEELEKQNTNLDAIIKILLRNEEKNG